jgi:hypothetical protein
VTVASGAAGAGLAPVAVAAPHRRQRDRCGVGSSGVGGVPRRRLRLGCGDG